MTGDYPYWETVPTRWKDNDVYGHVNNVVHYSLMDTVINAWMIRTAGFDPLRSPSIAVCVESHCQYRAEVSFPDEIRVGLRVGKLGRSSVRWEIGMLRSDGTLIAEGHFVHVFVGRDDRRPRAIVDPVRAEMQKLVMS
ncbi:Thioesterase superfamily protein [Actinomadura rubteroloni]|uniref:Thioesterase superfamily protein n=1 Tax=Actinomadura rubteroloni TaxID=1926885 RepID=A0A2P4UN98_9ACTN|nr:thioesterase family protein [Actinomadura rubteroloni]POM26524.1 Thioesterase superfamily protein [Actinomadura rubteroloni]